jgi:hypothetical protein
MFGHLRVVSTVNLEINSLYLWNIGASQSLQSSHGSVPQAEEGNRSLFFPGRRVTADAQNESGIWEANR